MKKDNNITTIDLNAMSETVGNIYGAVCILAKRAEQINPQIREEIHHKIEEYTSTQDELKEIFENQEQIKISEYYEKLPKPFKIAVDELFENKIDFKYINEDIDNREEGYGYKSISLDNTMNGISK